MPITTNWANDATTEIKEQVDRYESAIRQHASSMANSNIAGKDLKTATVTAKEVKDAAIKYRLQTPPPKTWKVIFLIINPLISLFCGVAIQELSSNRNTETFHFWLVASIVSLLLVGAMTVALVLNREE